MEEHGINSATLIVHSVKSRDSITWSQDSTERRVGQIKISEEDLERLREEKQKMEEYLEESKKDSKLKPTD